MGSTFSYYHRKSAEVTQLGGEKAQVGLPASLLGPSLNHHGHMNTLQKGTGKRERTGKGREKNL